MKTTFPHIHHIDQIRPHVDGRSDIRIMPRAHGFTINYLLILPSTWAEPCTLTHWFRRECRGLMFDHHGKIISRPYHKFFNLNENSFTTATHVDLAQPHVILEKLDGSMVRPFFDSQGCIRWATKMGETAIAQMAGEFAAGHKSIMDFVGDQLLMGFTPIFEWCSRKQRIVLDYPRDRLVLTALRNTITGEYVNYQKMVEIAEHSVEVVQAVKSHSDLTRVVNEVRSLSGQEGWVIRFDSGEMVKLKADEYLRQHQALNNLRAEKNVLSLILNDQTDDFCSMVSPEINAQLKEFEQTVREGILKRAHVLETAVAHAKACNWDRKTFAHSVVCEWPHVEERGILFQMLDGVPAVEGIINMLKKHLKSQSDVDRVRWVWGNACWKPNSQIIDE